MRIKRFLSLVIGFSTLIIVLSGCTTSPTGRSQFNLLGNSALDQQGVAAFDALKQKESLSRNPVEISYVQCVTDNLTQVLTEQEYTGDWEVAVFDSASINAFALPGGKIGVYTGILDVATTPDQLAAIIGHEIGHVLAAHSAERASLQMGTQLALIAGQAALQSSEIDPRTQQLSMSVLGLGAQFGVMMPYSRLHESEADIIGLALLIRAGYSPYGAVELWQNMEAATQGQQRPPELLSTHPSPDTRIQELEQAIPGLVKKYAGNRQQPQTCRV